MGDAVDDLGIAGPVLPDALPVGLRLGDYAIVRVIGQGGFGITYEGRHVFLGRRVAIKEFFIKSASYRAADGTVVLARDAEADGLSPAVHASLLARFQREAQKVSAKFDHPSIVQGEAYFVANGVGYFVMRYVPGETLEQWLRRLGRPPTEEELHDVMRPVLLAVDHVHDLDELHRDLTPRNIIVRPDGLPVVIDFGASREGLDRSSLTSVALATEGYAPPEQTMADGEALQGRYTDIYALGAVLYRAIAGKAPASAAERTSAIARRRAGRDPYRPAAEAALDATLYAPAFLAAVDDALRLDEDERPHSIGEFLDRLGWGRSQRPPPRRLRPAADATLLVDRDGAAAPIPAAPHSAVAPPPASSPPAVETEAAPGGLMQAYRDGRLWRHPVGLAILGLALVVALLKLSGRV